MAREPIFILNDTTFTASLVKVDRNKVYGWSETKYTDTDGNPCDFVTMLDDGKTMIGTGGLSLKSIDNLGNEIDKSTLVAKYADESEAILFPSIFDGETLLDSSKTISDYLDMDVKAVYQLNIVANKTELLTALAASKVLYFTFNYRPGYDRDDAFLIAQGENIFAITGKITNFAYTTLDLPAILDDETEETTEELDFNMF